MLSLSRSRIASTLRTARGAALLTLLAGALAGCFPALEEDPNFPRYFTKKVPGDTTQARLEGDRLYGSEVEMRKEGDTYRGNSAHGIIDLRASVTASGESRIEGEMGTGRTELYVREIPGGLTAQGLIAGTMSHFDLTPTRISGTIGACVYDLRQNAESRPYYEGLTHCGARRRSRGSPGAWSRGADHLRRCTPPSRASAGIPRAGRR